jgi:hypothetical protein
MSAPVMLPPRKAVLYVIDPSTGKLYPVKFASTPDGSAYISILNMPWQENIVIVPSATRTEDGYTTDIDVSRILKAEICIDVTDVSGTTPTLDVYIEGKDQLSGKYKVLFSQTGINDVDTFWTPNPIDIVFKYVRARWEISGESPSFTFSIGLEGKS